MLYNQYDKPNHNQESKYSPLNDPGMNVYPIQSIYYRPSPKKVFPCYTFGNNSELPEYFKLPNLYENRYSIDHSAKKRNKKLFIHNINSSHIFTQNSQCERKRGRRYIASLTANNQNNQHYQITINQTDLNRKYGIRQFDIISNRNYIPFQYIQPSHQKNYFSNLFKINQHIGNDNELRRITNRYRKLNGGQYVNQLKQIIPPKYCMY